MMRNRRRERGAVTVIAALAMTTLILFAALAIDVGMAWSSRSQSQQAANAAAVAAAVAMIDNSTPPPRVALDLARAAAAQYAGLHGAVGSPSLQLDPANDIAFGTWNPTTRALDPITNPGDPDQFTGVQVFVKMDGTPNSRSPSFLSQVDPVLRAAGPGIAVTASAIGYLGFKGGDPRGGIVLPIAIDSSDLSTGGCGTDFCSIVDNSPPNPCQLLSGPAVSCLEFDPGAPAQAQNACWTSFDPLAAVDIATLTSLVGTGNPLDLRAGDDIQLDAGVGGAFSAGLAGVFADISLKLAGLGGGGSWAALPGLGLALGGSGSVVVKLPVVARQDTNRCAGVSEITGFVCFEIRELIAPAAPIKGEIKGRFLCPNSRDTVVQQLFNQHCQGTSGPPSDPGGCNFGIRADRAVRVL